MLKKVLTLLLAFTLLLPSFQGVAAQRNIRVMYENRLVRFDVEPQVINGRTFVQYAPIAQAANARVNWDARNNRITVTSGNSNVVLTVGSRTAVIDGREVNLQAPARIVGGHTMVPLRFVADSLGHEVQWNAAQRTVRINRRNFVLRGGDGRRLILNEAPQRIVALSRSVITILHGLGITPVGIHETRLPLPAGLERVQRVGLPHNPNIETLVSLRPDLIIASTRFRAAGEPIFAQHRLNALFLDTFQFEDTLDTIRMFGRAFDKSAEANRLIRDIEVRRDRVLAQIRGEESPRVLILFGTAQAFMFATPNSYVGDLVRMLNGRNVVEETRIPESMFGFVPFSAEQAVALNPDVILRIAHGNPAESLRLIQNEFRNNPVWQNINAVRNNRVYDLDSNLFDPNPGVPIIDALEKLAEILYN